MSMPAALGWVIVRAVRDLPGLRLILVLRWAITYSMIQKWNGALLRVRRLAHSLKRDTRSAVVYHPADSPMSMTSPRTTLLCGHNAPSTLRPSAVPLLLLCHNWSHRACFFGAICGTQGRLLRCSRGEENPHYGTSMPL